MRDDILKICVVSLFLALIVGCGKNSQSSQLDSKIAQFDNEVLRFETPEQAVRSYFLDRKSMSPYYLKDAFRLQNLDEVRVTFEIVATSSTKDVALVQSRYSVGSKVFREATWLKKAGGSWLFANDLPNPMSHYFSETQVIDKGIALWYVLNKEWYDAAFKEGQKWVSESASLWEMDEGVMLAAKKISVEKTITNNLRQIAAASMQKMLDSGDLIVDYHDIVGPGTDKYISFMKPVAGESYYDITVGTATTRISVITDSGNFIKYDF